MISKKLQDVVRVILIHHIDIFQESLSPMKLQKLCYYAQGLYMATHSGEPLFDEDFEAWTFGPVIRNLYHDFSKYGWRNIDMNVESPNIPAEKSEFIKDIVESYGRYDGAALSTMTHREMPWLEPRKGLSDTDGSDALISKESMRIFFEEVLAPYQD